MSSAARLMFEVVTNNLRPIEGFHNQGYEFTALTSCRNGLYTEMHEPLSLRKNVASSISDSEPAVTRHSAVWDGNDKCSIAASDHVEGTSYESFA